MEYAKNIERLASDKKTEIFYNSCDEHALIVLKNLVKNAERYIKIICGNLCSDVSNDEEYLRIVDNFLSKNNTTIDILFDNYDNQCFECLPIFGILKKYPRQVKVRSLISGHINYEESPVHLTVSDDRAFRLETEIDKKMAWGNFNDEPKARVFSDAFDRFFTDKYSTLIPLAG